MKGILSSEDINKMIKKQQELKKKSQPNVNEYTMIKNNYEAEENESLTSVVKDHNENLFDGNDFNQVRDEVINVDDEEHEEDEGKEENIEDLKASIQDVPNELI